MPSMIRSRRVLGFISLVLVLATGLTSCTTGDSPTGPSTIAVRDSQNLYLPIVTPLLNGLVGCSTQTYGQTTKVVGPLGGTVKVNNHTLVIPAGALTRNVTITATAPADNVSSVQFQPEGLQFARPVKLTLDYSFCPLGRLDLFKHIAYTTDNLNILSLLLSVDDLLRMRISSDIRHFSRYAVAW
jgi:hypothetical protein